MTPPETAVTTQQSVPDVVASRRAASANPGLGIGLKVAATLAFVVMGAIVKLLSNDVPIGQMMFFRSFFALVPLIIWLRIHGVWPDATRTARPWLHARRSLVGALAMFSTFTALSYLPLPDATVLGYTAPLIAVALAAVILKERVRLYRWSAVGVGFVGVLVMLSPHLSRSVSTAGVLDGAATGALFALLGSLFVGLVTTEIRRLTLTETTGAIVFYFSLFTSVFSLVSIAFGWTVPSPTQAMLLVGSGVLGGIGQILMTQSYQHADASLIAPFEYTSMLWALLIGWFVFGHLPEPVVLAGAAIVVGAGLYVIWRERALGLERRRQREAAPMESA